MQERIGQLEMSLPSLDPCVQRVGYPPNLATGHTSRTLGVGRKGREVFDSEELIADFRCIFQLMFFQVQCHNSVGRRACLVIRNRIKIRSAQRNLQYTLTISQARQ